MGTLLLSSISFTLPIIRSIGSIYFFSTSSFIDFKYLVMSSVMCEPLEKRPRLDNCDIFDHLSDEDSCVSDESCYTWQGYETAWVKDSGDDWSPSSSESELDEGNHEAVFYEVEYEIASDSTTNQNDSDSEGSSDLEAAILPIIAATYDLEDECLAGSESSEDGIIRKSPLPQPDRMIADRWKCLRCGVLNVPPMRFCHKCYEIRKGWLDPRPKPRRRRGNHNNRRTGPESQGDGPSTSSTSSQLTGKSLSQSSMDSNKDPCSCSSLCELCGIQPIDGAFMHGNTGHQLYCYSCSKRVWRERKQCPACRRTIAKVAKMFNTSC